MFSFGEKLNSHFCRYVSPMSQIDIEDKEEFLLLEMSMSLSDAESKITNVRTQICRHVLFCVIDTKNSSFNHWITELHSFFEKINDITLKIKGNPHLSTQQLRRWLCNEFLDLYSYKNMVDGVLFKLNKESQRVGFYNKFEGYKNLILEICDRIGGRTYTKDWLKSRLEKPL